MTKHLPTAHHAPRSSSAEAIGGMPRNSSASTPRYGLGLGLCACATITLLTGCGSERAAARPLVIGSVSKMGDLYWNGQLNDSLGNRWDIGFMPGIAPTGRVVGRSYERAWGYIKNMGTTENGDDNLVRVMYRFGLKECIGNFIGSGIGRDYSSTSSDIAELCNERPFGWFAQLTYRSVWGYVIKPTGRVVFGSLGAAGGIAGGTACGVVEGAGRTAAAVGDVAVMGTVYPAVRLAWHQPAFLFSVLNAEPDIKQDGTWTLHIINYSEPPKSKATESAPDSTIN